MERMNAEVFLAVLETGSFRRAAEKLGYTQAGISYIIHAMEEETGLPLFVREHSGVRLSPEGQLLLPMIRQLEVWERQFRTRVNELKELECGTLRIQIFDSISIHWIPGILRKFHDDYPGITIELVTEEDSVRSEEMVLSGEVDCGFFLTGVHGEMDVFPLLEENLKAVVAPDHPLAELDRFPLDRIGDFPYISMKYDDHTGIMDIFRRQGVSPQTLFCLDNDYAAMAMVSKGLGYCIFPELLLQDIPYEVRTLDFDRPQRRIVSIGTASILTCSKACAKFIEYTRAWVKENTERKY